MALVVSKECDALLNDLQAVKGIEVVEGADVDEARFRVKGGEPLIEIPDPSKFETTYHQAISIVHACSHAELYMAAKGRADRAAAAGRPDEEAEARVAAYQTRTDRRANN